VPVLLVDPGVLPDELAGLAAELAAGVDDPRLAGWPPMTRAHAGNARGLLASLVAGRR
jgi:hypothetical protein